MTGALARTAALASFALFASACGSVELTPAAIATAHAPEDLRADVFRKWRVAVTLANDFLASDWRLTLPPGRLELADGSGMRFVSPLGTWPIEVRCTWWGDVVCACGFAAQEREHGFVVGESEPERDRLVDNTLFVNAAGWRKPPSDVAELILHETTHVVWREGTVGFWNGVAYYLEAIFLFRYADHSAERKANATTEEFMWFAIHRERDPDLDAHLKAPHDECTHGPFAEPPPAAPMPPEGTRSRLSFSARTRGPAAA